MATKEKIELEYPIRTSTELLFPRLSTASGLAEWFADDVKIQKKTYTFKWGKQEQKALLLQKKERKYIRYQWIDNQNTDYYFEFSINKIELTSDIALIVCDFAEVEDKDDVINLWNRQVRKLKRQLGAF